MSAVISPLVLRSYIAGLTLSNDSGTPNTVVDIAAGQAADSSNAVMMNSTGVLTVNFATTGAGALDIGSIAATSWYHLYLIAKVGGAVAGLASLSLTPSLPSGYSYYRRLGSVKTDGSSHILAFVQDEDTFYWGSVVQDVSVTNLSTSATLYTLSVPNGVKVRPLIRYSANNATILSSPDETDVAPTTTLATSPGYDSNSSLTGGIVFGPMFLFTNTSAQLRARAQTGGATMVIITRGWTDSRGKFA